MGTALNAYNGRKIKTTAEGERHLVLILTAVARMDRDQLLINARTFWNEKLKVTGISLKETLDGFASLADAGICKLKKGSEDRLERAEFSEPARRVARQILGYADAFIRYPTLDSPAPSPAKVSKAAGPNRKLDAAREILRSQMSAAAKIDVLKTLLLKE